MNWPGEIKRRIQACVVIVLIFVVLGLFAEYFWVFDLFTHFRIQYAVSLFIAAGVLFLLKARRWAALSAGSGLVLAVWTAPYWVPYASSSSEGEITLMAYNVRTGNHQYEKVAFYIRESESDLVLITEINSEWEKRLNELDEIYPYSISHSREDNFGILLLSRYELIAGEVRSFAGTNLPSIIAEIGMPTGYSLYLVGTHPPPPVGRDQFEMRNQQLLEIAEFCQTKKGKHVVVTGDLNLTPHSPHFTNFIHQAGLVDSGRGRGWQTTWFSHMPWIAIPIDHALCSENVEITNRDIGPTMGSDHNPVILNFRLR